jgi:transcriptional regulator with XRE-family HTH domain
MPEFKNRVRRSLRVAMAKADMDAQELADKSGVSYDAILRYLRGETGPLLETACKIAEALGCSPNDLCGIE